MRSSLTGWLGVLVLILAAVALTIWILDHLNIGIR